MGGLIHTVTTTFNVATPVTTEMATTKRYGQDNSHHGDHIQRCKTQKDRNGG